MNLKETVKGFIATLPLPGKAVPFSRQIACGLAVVLAVAVIACSASKAKAQSGGSGARTEADDGSSGANDSNLDAAVKALDGKKTLDDVIKRLQVLNDAEIDMLLERKSSPVEIFRYDLTEDGKGIVIAVDWDKGKGYDIVLVPPVIEGYPVTEIVESGNAKVILLPNTITRIGFVGDMRFVNMPRSLKEIGRWAFRGLKMTSLRLPEGLEKMDIQAFEGSELTEVTLPGSLKWIPNMAFAGVPIKEIVFPEGVEIIGGGIFGTTPGAGTNTTLVKVTLPSTIKEIRNAAFINCTALTDIVIPDNVRSIRFGYNAFSSCPNLKFDVRQRLKALGYKE